jgi:hypothetical protein
MKVGSTQEEISQLHSIPVEEVQALGKEALALYKKGFDPEAEIYLAMARLEDLYKAISSDHKLEFGDLRYIREAQKIIMNKMQILGLDRPTINIDARGATMQDIVTRGGEAVFRRLQEINQILEGAKEDP